MSAPEAARRLLEARRSRKPLDPAGQAWSPASVADACAVQDAVVAALGPVAGWKVGAGDPQAEPGAAPLPESLVMASPARVPAGSLFHLGLEAEIAYRLGRDLPPRATPYDAEAVMDAIASVHPAIEVVDSRLAGYPDVPRMWHVADHQSNGAFVYGPGRTDWRAVDPMRQRAILSADGKVIADTTGGNKAVDLMRLVVWLANHAATRAGGLKAGMFVTTGSCTGLLFTEPGAAVRAEFPGLGVCEVSFPA